MIRVLIVDDDKLARKGLISIVPWADCGMEVVGEAANGAKALDFLEANPVELAVVDLTMPVMTGLEFIEASRERWPELQYVVLSFHEDFQNVQSALRLGTLDYISKMRLEQSDCTEVFRRVGKLLQSKDAPETAPGENGTTSEGWQEIKREWLHFGWLYSADILESLRTQTLALAPSPRQIEHLLVRVHETAGEAYQWSQIPGVPGISGVEEGLGWLEKLGKALTEELIAREDSGNTAVCLLRAAEYIRGHIAEPLSMKAVAQQVNLSRSYFAASFKKATGMTFNHFLRMERVRAARTLLEKGTVPVHDVAQHVGYEDVKYFAQVFTQQVGVTPMEYRARCVGGL
ncbi:AraC family transcriptional regulator [Ruminococcaceae bacterium OttesenSCG-928-L11]|nr:AraC family transcriptional regulator [Ruminococcaceae bacterium OttesenSCG-928-L11]